METTEIRHDLDFGKLWTDIKNGVTNAANATVKTIQQVASNVGAGAAVLPLAPFFGLMGDILKKKGIPASSDLTQRAIDFYNYVVMKKPYYGKMDIIIPPEILAMIPAIVAAIIAWVKDAWDKAKAGVALTAEQQVAVTQAKQVADEIASASNNTQSTNSTGVSTKDMLMYGGIAAAIIVIVFLLMRKK